MACTLGSMTLPAIPLLEDPFALVAFPLSGIDPSFNVTIASNEGTSLSIVEGSILLQTEDSKAGDQGN